MRTLFSRPRASAADPAATVPGTRRAVIGLGSLIVLLSAGALLPGLGAFVGVTSTTSDGPATAPLAVLLAAIAIVAVLGVRIIRLQRRCRHLERARDVDGHAARHDPLTGSANRRRFEDRLEELVADEAPAHALLMIDLDRFKPVNDLYGHAAGDALLKDIAAGLARLLGPDDLLARLGGDEFAVLLHETTDAAAARTALAVLEFVTRYRLDWEGQRIGVGTSIGLIAVDRPGLVPSELLASADAALYAAKEAGRGAVFAADPTPEASGAPALRRIDAGTPEPVSSARSHEPEDGRHQELHAAVMIGLPAARPTHWSPRQGSRRRREVARWVAVEPVTVGDAATPGLTTRELLEDATARADGGADLVRWMLAMALNDASALTPTALGRIGFALPLPARAVVAVPTLGDELLRANAIAVRPIRHLAFVLHHVAPVYDDPALARFHHRMRAGDVRVGFEIRSSTLDVLAPLRHVPYEELHLGRELIHGLRAGGSGHATLETLLTVAERSAATLVATGIDSTDTIRHLGTLGVKRFAGPGVARSEPLRDVLERLKSL